MANTKISALTALTGATLATDDAFAVVDTSATATKSITTAELKLGIMPAPGPIGGTTPSTGAFTSVSATGDSTITKAGGDLFTVKYNPSNAKTGFFTGASSGATFVGSNITWSAANLFNYDKTGLAWYMGHTGNSVLEIGCSTGTAGTDATVSTAATARIAIATNGNVMIGTAIDAGTGKLQVAGNVAVTGTISATTGAAVGGATAGAGGLAFPATAVAVADANTLDDYEEGSFTPAANVVTYSAATGRYTKIGNVVTIIFSITFPATADTADAQITNLPFTVSTGSSVALSGYTTDVNGQATNGSTILRFIKADGSAYKTNASLSTQVLFGTLVYRV